MMDNAQRVTRESAAAKLFASEAAVEIANEALQIHGGYGYIKDYPAEKFIAISSYVRSVKGLARFSAS